jgi:wyosine [tRNA(Phe)-imidazoG37] synthetase (radical SAM superfamily)
MISFGPIPSRRLGKSLGINNISARKVCSFSCRYCQLGVTKKFSVARRSFYEPDIIYAEVHTHLEKLKNDDKPDFLTFVANGEPTLDINLGKSIEKLKQFNIPIAVITNASLLRNPNVRNDLNLADWVSVKVDANTKSTWDAINWPSNLLNFESHVIGILEFSGSFKGKLVTETMLVKGVNDGLADLIQTADLIGQINPSVAYISIPTRPPAIHTVLPADADLINEAYQIFSEKGINAELILGFEGTNTGYTGNAIEDIVNICTVHPIREDTLMEIMRKDCADQTILDTLIKGKYIKQVKYKSDNYYIRQFHD